MHFVLLPALYPTRTLEREPSRSASAMSTGYLRIASCMIATLVACLSAHAQSYDRAAVEMFKTLQKKPTPLARYTYLEEVMPRLSEGNRILAQQMSAFSLSELGLYSQAVLAFPLKMRELPGLQLPAPPAWRGEDAVAALAKLAKDRRLVLINEVHHNAQTRVLTLELLPRLRELGFTHLAIEALGEDPALMERGYPLASSGTEYLQEPIYGDIVREAIRLGFVLVPYDAPELDVQARETAQARNLYDRVFKRDPTARLVVAAGYAHVDKGVGRLGKARPMAMTLATLSGIEPLSIDQSQFAEARWDEDDDYHVLIERFPSDSAQILLNTVSGTPWSAEPGIYDISVILPPALSRKAFGEEEMTDSAIGRYRILNSGVQLTTEAFLALNDMQRPGWLALGGQRSPFPVDTRLCRSQIPCVIDAHYLGEPDAATPADRYAFLMAFTSTDLYLRPGRYRLRASNSEGRTLSESTITVAGH